MLLPHDHARSLVRGVLKRLLVPLRLLLFINYNCNYLVQSNNTKHSKHFQLPTQTINMSAPNVDRPNEGIVGQAVNSVKNAANYVSETVQGNAAEASKEANKGTVHLDFNATYQNTNNENRAS